MNWKENLQSLIKTPLKELKKGREDLTYRYRNHLDKRMRTRAEKESYLLTRMPATFEVALKVLSQANPPFSSMLDLGAGPGTAGLAALELWDIPSYSIEQDKDLLEWSKILNPKSQGEVGDFTKIDLPEHDLVVLSYSIGEIKNYRDVIEKAWRAAKKTLVIIEPGTPKASFKLMEMRSRLIQLGASLWAPCPHNNPCPLIKPDWCHFSTRVARDKTHKLLKEGELGYEDEKYSYLIFSKENRQDSYSRILKEPKVHSGHFEWELCTKAGLKKETITKSHPAFRSLKKLGIGDCKFDELSCGSSG